MSPSLEKKKKSLDNYARYSSIAFQMLAIILVGVFGGIRLDKWVQFNTPVFTIILSILSVILAMYYVTRDLLRTGKKTGKQDQSKEDESKN